VKRTIFVFIGIYLAFCFTLAARVHENTDNRPNVILTENQRFNIISALGNDETETPKFNRLVDQGISFTHAHIMGGSHTAVCMPSRAMLMTGRALFSLEREGQRIPGEHITIGEFFQKQAYTTAHDGKWHNDSRSHHRSFTTGRKIFGLIYLPYKITNAHWHTPVYDFQPYGQYDTSKFYHDPPLEPFSKPNVHNKVNGRHSAEVFTDGAIVLCLTSSPSVNEGDSMASVKPRAVLPCGFVQVPAADHYCGSLGRPSPSARWFHCYRLRRIISLIPHHIPAWFLHIKVFS
jgi:arylsulfatase A-like enzyme